MIPRRYALTGGFVGLLAMFLLPGCHDIEVASLWRTRPVVVDGSDADWSDMLMYFKEQNISLGVCNDDRDLYICFITTDPAVERQLAGAGFTIWLDSAGGSDKSFGIHYPLGFQGMRDESVRRSSEEDDPDQGGSFFQRITGELEVVGRREDDRVRMAAPGSGGILVQMNRTNGRLVYELKVPLARTADEKYAVGTDTGRSIGLGLEMSAPAGRRVMGEAPEGGEPGRGRGRRFGGEGSPRGEGSTPRERSAAQSLNLWMKVDLAGAPPGIHN